MEILGIDVGGTGIKGNIVDIVSGQIIGQKYKIKTPTPASPTAIIECLQMFVQNFEWQGKPIGIGFPSVIKNGYALTASNIDHAFIQYPIEKSFSQALGCPVSVVNDADAAGIAEITYAEGLNRSGLIVFLTLGTGIGSAIFHNGVLLSNTEMGQLYYKKSVFEKYASNSARENKGMSWKSWAKELNIYLNHLELILNPDLIILGGGVSKNYAQYASYLTVKTPIRIAKLLNDSGLVGAAMMAYSKL